MMTNREITTVKRTLRQWEWLRDNPDKDKEDYFDAHPQLKPPKIFLCYLCDLWHNEIWIDPCELDYRLNCDSKCPLATKTLMCNTADDNPYDLWDSEVGYNKEEAAKQASRIVGACKRWLKKYDVKGR